MDKPLRILILEDNPADAKLMQFELEEAGIAYTAKVVAAEKDFIGELRKFSPDLILSDYDLPFYTGQSALTDARRHCPDVPFILVTGAVTEDRAIDILTNGAVDFVMKNRLHKLPVAVRRAMEVVAEHKARKKAEAEVRAASLYVRSLIEASLDPLVTISTDGKVMDVNRATEEVTGISRDHLIGTEFASYFTEPEKARAALEKAFSHGSVKNYPLALRHISGPITEVIYNAATYTDETGTVQGVFAAARDVTVLKKGETELKASHRALNYQVKQTTAALDDEKDRRAKVEKQAEEVLKQQLAKLEAANKDLDSFAYSVSHDLRAPLRAIDGFSKILLKKTGKRLDQDEIDLISIIRDNVQKMGQLLDGLLALSHVGRETIFFATIDMYQLACEVWQSLQQINPHRRMEITIEPLPPAYGDIRLIRQVMMNLLTNAIKFTQKNEEALITIGGTSQKSENVYCVRDNGAGFDMKCYGKLFGVFNRLHSEEAYEGTGVGLAIIQRIINRHGGRVWAEGKENEGAVFYFSLPRQ